MRTSLVIVLILGLIAGASVLPARAADRPVQGAAPAGESARVAESPAADFARRDLIAGILRDARDRAGKDFDPRFRADATQKLLALPADELSRLAGQADGLKTVGARSLGSTTGDLVYTPIPPCRIFDSRTGSGLQGDGGGPIVVGTPRAIDVAGGAAGSCVPFPTAKAVVFNFTVVNPAGPGDLRAWPWDSSNPPPPNSSVINYAAVSGLNLANGIVVAICNTSTATGGTCTKDLFLVADSHPTHLVIDVLGYFSAPAATALDCTRVSAPFSAAMGTQFNIGSGSCPAGYTLTGGGIELGTAWTSGDELLGTNPFSDEWQCIGYNGGGNTWTGNCWALCCRTPGR
jgi:hypothetical protein